MKLHRGFVSTGLVGWAALVAIALTVSAPAQAQISVSGPFVDDETQGDWRGTYGNCFVLIPDPVESLVEEPVGPDYFSDEHLQYRYTNCYEGPWFNNDPELSRVDWRIYRNGQPPHAFAWHAVEIDNDASQWNPCRDAFYHATWDNDGFPTDPLTVELKLNVEGDITLAYYFTNSTFACREHDYELEIDGMTFPGTIGDFRRGKYVYFNISGLETSAQGTTINFTVVDTPGEPLCANSPFEGPNSIVSGVFIGGDCTPTDCPVCGNGILEDGEECDLGEQNGVPGSGCSADCEIVGGPICGNGILEEGEECDLGEGNGVPGSGCDYNCRVVLEPDCSCDDGKPGTLVFRYTGDGCDGSNNNQSSDSCDGDPNNASPVMVKVVSDGAMAMPAMVMLNQNVSIVATNGRLKSNTTLEIRNPSGVLQSLNIHTSCSQDLEVGDQFGSLLLVDFIPEGGTGVCGGDDEGGDDEGSDDSVDRGLRRESAGADGIGGSTDVQFGARSRF
jgi:cysteine-rich repeat protein